MPSTWATGPAAGAIGLERHLAGAALARGSPSHGATLCGLTVSNHPLRLGRRHCLRPQAPAMPAGGRACWRLALKGLWSWPTAPLQRALALAGYPLQPAWPWVAGPTWGLC
ncbi:hypothetical protein GW17_00036849 [Ensete ventricosum]|nr:hypothetical protein GW17_00036849 [Ensete ventricosum]